MTHKDIKKAFYRGNSVDIMYRGNCLNATEPANTILAGTAYNRDFIDLKSFSGFYPNYDLTFSKSYTIKGDCSKFFSRNISNIKTITSFPDTTNVTNMSNLFSSSKLMSVDLSKIGTTKNVTDMSYMFSGCSGLTTLDLSKFNTRNVTYMSYMFSNCSGLTTLDLSKFNTRNVTDMSYMFSGCSGLTTLDISNFDFSNVEHMSWIFSFCENLTTIKFPDNCDFSNVRYMNNIFNTCENLQNITGNISGFRGDIDLMSMTQLSRESIMIIINGLGDVKDTPCAICIPETLYTTLSTDVINRIKSLGWEIYHY